MNERKIRSVRKRGGQKNGRQVEKVEKKQDNMKKEKFYL
jgi:hypothetical protein